MKTTIATILLASILWVAPAAAKSPSSDLLDAAEIIFSMDSMDLVEFLEFVEEHEDNPKAHLIVLWWLRLNQRVTK